MANPPTTVVTITATTRQDQDRPQIVQEIAAVQLECGLEQEDRQEDPSSISAVMLDPRAATDRSSRQPVRDVLAMWPSRPTAIPSTQPRPASSTV